MPCHLTTALLHLLRNKQGYSFSIKADAGPQMLLQDLLEVFGVLCQILMQNLPGMNQPKFELAQQKTHKILRSLVTLLTLRKSLPQA